MYITVTYNGTEIISHSYWFGIMIFLIMSCLLTSAMFVADAFANLIRNNTAEMNSSMVVAAIFAAPAVVLSVICYVWVSSAIADHNVPAVEVASEDFSNEL